MTREEQAKRLSTETGYLIRASKSCYTLWDGRNLWFPLYRPTDVRRKAMQLKSK